MKIYQVETDEHKQHVRELFWEYLKWANQNLNESYDIDFDIATIIEEDMKTLAKFMPPEGRLVLAEIDGEIAGLACMKRHADAFCEIKRMYVRPAFRRKGVAQGLLQYLIDDAKQMNFPIMRLDSSGFMTAAHALYRSIGFEEIDPYEGSEIPKEFQHHWIFMELKLV